MATPRRTTRARDRPAPPARPAPARAAATSRPYHHGDLANALVSVAIGLVDERGVEDFSLREASVHCGVSVSAAYKHFASKDALLTAVADLGFESLADGMEERIVRAARGLSRRARAEAALVEAGSSYIRFAVERPNLFRLMYGPHGPKGGGRDPRPDAPARRLAVILIRAIDGVLEAYGRGGAGTGTHMTIAWALVHGFAMMVIDGVWVEGPGRPLDAMIAELGQAVLRSLR